MNVLAIETSCDDTAVAVVTNGTKVLSSLVSSQEKVHSRYHGIVPELASRTHLENINFLLYTCLTQSFPSGNRPFPTVGSGQVRVGYLDLGYFNQIDAFAVTSGPGLIGSLLVGTSVAKTLSYVTNKPLVSVNHIEGHIFANFLREQSSKDGFSLNINHLPSPVSRLPITKFSPFIALIISGGHTDLVLVNKPGKYRMLGSTRDDAVGEVYDKIARQLGLPYPGGPYIDKLASKGNPRMIKFPRPYLPGSYDFSFSGLKTAVVNYISSNSRPLRVGYQSKQLVADVCAAFQESVVDVLTLKSVTAAKKCGVKNILLGGGVAANTRVRERFKTIAKTEKLNLILPAKSLCTDNAAMIAAVAYYKLRMKVKSQIFNPPFDKFIISDNLPLSNWY